MSKPNYSGTFHMVEQQNMDGYLAALGKTRIAFVPVYTDVTLKPKNFCRQPHELSDVCCTFFTKKL